MAPVQGAIGIQPAYSRCQQGPSRRRSACGPLMREWQQLQRLTREWQHCSESGGICEGEGAAEGGKLVGEGETPLSAVTVWSWQRRRGAGRDAERALQTTVRRRGLSRLEQREI
eukprot:2882446-Rhodomonas_salina.1